MHGFKKGPQPTAFTDWIVAKTRAEGRALEDIGWDELTAEAKNAIRLELARVQGYLCAYCGGRIRPSAKGMRIEHWATQVAFPAKRFEWDNLLGVCLGTDGRESWCDVHRGQRPLQTKPDRDEVRRIFRYSTGAAGDGLRISSTDEGAQRDVDDVLNLNAERQRRNRADALRAFQRGIQRVFGDKAVSKAHLSRAMAVNPAGEHEPYWPALLDTIERYMSKAR